jgi:hypothetical protein
MLGVIGEYLWRVADEVRGSPPFVIESRLGTETMDDEAVLATKAQGHGENELLKPAVRLRVKGNG